MPGTLQRLATDAMPPECRRIAPPPPATARIEAAKADPAFYRRILREMRELGVEALGLSYLADPFLCRWLPEAIRFAKEDCEYPRVFVTTGGREASSARVRACMEAGLDGLEFHLDSGGEEQVGENLKGARRVRDEVVAATGHRCGVEVASPRPARQPPCAALFVQGHVTFDGRLSACPIDQDARFDMGNLVHHGFMRAWHGERFQRLRRAHLAEELAGTPCERCTG